VPLCSICGLRSHLFCSWGEFEIQIRITFVPESGEKAINTHHLLKLHPFVVVQQFKDNPGMQNQLPPPIQSWQYDEIVFTDPLQNFFNILIEHPPTPLPATKRRPIPFHISLPSSSYEADENSGDGKGGGVPAEFTQSIIKEEADRLQMAFNEVQTQIHKVFTLQHTKTRELEALKQQEAGGA
jgi:YEATS domain-containing protein 4